jgi:ATP-dependent protease ClpP protease subunit
MKAMSRAAINKASERSARPGDNFMFMPPFQDEDSIKYYKQEIRVNLHHFYIVEEIGDVGEFLDLINILKTAEAHDTIFIYLNTPGGNLYTAIQIISAIRQSGATVITCLEGEVASAGTLIFLAGHKYVVNPNCTFMIHNYSHWVGGKGNEVAIRVKYSEQYFRTLASDMYGKFLTPQELDDVLNGKDIWLDSDQVLARLGATDSSSMIADVVDGPSPPDAFLVIPDQELKAETPAVLEGVTPKKRRKKKQVAK